jgi:hypothetical protein
MAARGKARIVVANRAQLSWDLINPEGWLAPDHRARLVVGFVETLDLTVLYDRIEAREGTAGRPAADPLCCLRCGCWRRWTGWGRRANWTG